jgi:hypothetical protein
MLRSYARLILFTFGLLVGVQVPGFINDYSHRVESHLIEAQQSLKGFNDTANQFFNGNLQALVEHYRSSEDPVFRSDATSIGNLVTRQAALDAEWQALQGPWYQKAWHVITAADPAIRDETFDGYTYQVLLAPEAIAWGIACAFLLAWLIEGFIVLLDWAFAGGRHRGKISKHESWR